MSVETDRAPAGGTRLGRLAQRRPVGGAAVAPAVPAEERCELCSAPLAPQHRHMLDLEARRLLCACRACTVLFDRSAAGGRHYRLLPDESWRLDDVALGDELWAALSIPVEMAFFFFDSAAGRIVALYPSPVGATESLLPLAAWEEITARNPVLARLQPDVEALLVNRTRGAREHWLVPVDACYALVGLIRMHWKGLSGGEEVWEAIGRFFDDLRERATVVRSDGNPGVPNPVVPNYTSAGEMLTTQETLTRQENST